MIICNGIREETDRYISAGKVQKLIFDFSKTGFMDSSGIGILLGATSACIIWAAKCL